MLEHKFLPETRTGQLEPTRISEGVVGVSKLAGDLAKAVVGDVAAGMRADPEFSGNIPAFFKGEELPMDTALRDAAEEQKFRGEVPIATVMGRISEGLASTAPMIPLMAEFPPAAQQTALALFTAKMIKDTPGIARQLGDEFGKPPDQRDPDKIDSLVAEAIQTVGFAAAGGVGVRRSLTPEEPPAKIPLEWREIQRPIPDTSKPAAASVPATAPKAEPTATPPKPAKPGRLGGPDIQQQNKDIAGKLQNKQ